MTTLINARPRFGLEGERLFCYVTSRYYDITPGAMLESDEGVWPLEKVAELIRAGATIERALVVRHSTPDISSELQRLRAKNEEDELHIVKLAEEIDQLKAGPQPESQPDKVEQAAADFNAATPAPAAGDKVEQAKQDFLSGSEEEILAIGTGQIPPAELPPGHYDKPADVEGAMAPEEAPPTAG